MSAIIGDLSIEMEDGTVLTSNTDLGLAWKWAEHVYGDKWATMMPLREQWPAVAEALEELRRSAGQA